MKKIAIILLSLFIITPLAGFSLYDGIKDTDDKRKTTHFSGTVIDANTGEALVGVCVTIQGSEQTAYTGLDGNFTFSNIKTGTYTLETQYVSYEKNIHYNIQVLPENKNNITLKLNKIKE